jgi:hypothetical protein
MYIPFPKGWVKCHFLERGYTMAGFGIMVAVAVVAFSLASALKAK